MCHGSAWLELAGKIPPGRSFQRWMYGFIVDPSESDGFAFLFTFIKNFHICGVHMKKAVISL
jgi:hypothetical protein